jgi:hypothetical protein
MIDDKNKTTKIEIKIKFLFENLCTNFFIVNTENIQNIGYKINKNLVSNAGTE